MRSLKTGLHGPEMLNTSMDFSNCLEFRALTGGLIKSRLSVMHAILLCCSLFPPSFLTIALPCLLDTLGYFQSRLDLWLADSAWNLNSMWGLGKAWWVLKKFWASVCLPPLNGPKPRFFRGYGNSYHRWQRPTCWKDTSQWEQLLNFSTVKMNILLKKYQTRSGLLVVIMPFKKEHQILLTPIKMLYPYT